MADSDSVDMEEVMRQSVQSLWREGWSYEGVTPYTRSERGLAVTVAMAGMTAALSGLKVSRMSIYNWLRDGKLKIIGYVISPQNKRRLPVFWSHDFLQLVEAIPPTLNRFAPGTSGNPRGRQPKMRPPAQQSFT